MTTTEVDVAVIGAGPTGLYAAYCAGFRGMTTAVIDSLNFVGGQVMSLYPEKPVYDVAGLFGIPGRDLVRGLTEQADHFAPHYLLGCQVESFTRHNDRIALATDGGSEVSARAVVLAVGIGSATPRRLPISAEWEGRGLSYTVDTPADFADQDVVIVGGGDSALDWALLLEPIARSVTLVHRRSTFRGHASSVRDVMASAVEVVTEAEIVAAYGDALMHTVQITDHARGTTFEVPATKVVAALGFISNLGPIKQWPVDLEGGRHLVVNSRMQTSVPGIYAAGDATEYPGKVRLMSVGFGEAATAVNNIAVMVDPAASLFPGHSTDSITLAG
jgi:thioredoxin reductase